MKSFFLTVAACFLAALSLTSQATDMSHWSPSGHLTYEVYRGDDGIYLGKAKHRWQSADGRYTMELKLEPIKLIRMIYDFRYSQHSEGWVTKDGLKPEHFKVTQRGRDPQTADFDWDAHKVTVTRKKKGTDYPLTDGVQDFLSVWHSIAIEGAEVDDAPLAFVTHRRLSQAQLSYVGNDILDLPIGKIQARHLTVKSDTEKYDIDLWVSDRYQNMPVRILATDKKGGKFDLQLREAELGATVLNATPQSLVSGRGSRVESHGSTEF
jgi:hypothetical protein